MYLQDLTHINDGDDVVPAPRAISVSSPTLPSKTTSLKRRRSSQDGYSARLVIVTEPSLNERLTGHDDIQDMEQPSGIVARKKPRIQMECQLEVQEILCDTVEKVSRDWYQNHKSYCITYLIFQTGRHPAAPTLPQYFHRQSDNTILPASSSIEKNLTDVPPHGPLQGLNHKTSLVTPPLVASSTWIAKGRNLTTLLPLPQDGKKLTRSQRLFSAFTGISAESLTISDDAEFFLFMEMRTEFQWATNNMTPIMLTQATAEYNKRLRERKSSVSGGSKELVLKSPRAMIDRLTSLEAQITRRIASNNFKCKFDWWMFSVILERNSHNLHL